MKKEKKKEGIVKQKFTGKLAAIGVGMAMLAGSVFGFVGCTPTEKVDKTIPAEISQEIVESVGALKNQNYSCDLTTGNNTVSYKFNKDKISVVENKNDGVFYSIGEDGTVKFDYDSSKDGYVKTESSFNIDGVIYNSLKDASWKEYDKEKDVVSGSMGGKDVTLKLEDNGNMKVEGEGYKASIFDVEKTSVALPDNIIDNNNTEEAEIPFEKINSAIKRLESKNFTLIVGGNVSSTYKVAGDAVSIEKNGSTKFFVKENDLAFDIVFDSKDNKWHKKFAENNLDVNDLLYNDLKSVNWTVYDEKTGIVSGTMNGTTVSMEMSNEGIRVFGVGFDVEVSNMNSTSVKFPNENEIVDDTKPVEINEIYTMEDGKIVYNMAAITDVLTSWIKKDNNQNRDLLGYKSFNNNISLDRILYTNVLDNKIEIGLLFNNSNQLNYTTYEIDENAFFKRLKNGELTTEKDLLSDLKSISILDFNNTGINKKLDYTTLDIDFETIHKEQFDKLTSQVFAKLKETGVQLSAGDKNGRKEDLTGMEIIAGFKGKRSDSISTGSDLGNYFSWDQGYVVKDKNNKYKLVIVTVFSSVTFNDAVIENVLNGDEGWIVANLDKKDLDKGTGAIYQKEEKQNLSTASLTEPTYTYIMPDGEYRQVNIEEWNALREAEFGEEYFGKEREL